MSRRMINRKLVPRGTALEKVTAFGADKMEKLRGLWIETVQEFVALARTPQGRNSLSEYLDITTDPLGTAGDLQPQPRAQDLLSLPGYAQPALGHYLTRTAQGPPGPGKQPFDRS